MIIRVEKEREYFAVSNKVFNDERLSWEARGVLGYFLSKPDNWNPNAVDLWKRGPGGRDKARRIMKELEKFGYLERKRTKNDKGQFEWEVIIYEKSAKP